MRQLYSIARLGFRVQRSAAMLTEVCRLSTLTTPKALNPEPQTFLQGEMQHAWHDYITDHEADKHNPN